MAENVQIRAGDTVYHAPSEETWVVAAVFEDELAWAGWPPGVAHTSDCKLVRTCTDETHVEMARHDWPADDYRRSLARRHDCEICRQARLAREAQP